MKHVNGFTFIELVFSIFLIAVLSVIGLPSMLGYIELSKSKALKSALYRMNSTARAQAISLDRKVTLCGTNQLDWSLGRCQKTNFKNLTAFIDQNKNRKIDADERIIFQHRLEYDGELQLRASFGRTYIEYNEDGSTNQAGSFIYCHPEQPRAAARVTVSMSSRAYVGKDRNQDGVVEKVNGRPISC